MGVLEVNVLEDVEEIRCEWLLGVEMVVMLNVFCVSQYCMSSLFVMVASFWMMFWEHKAWSFWCLSVIEGKDVVFSLMAEDVWYYEYKLTGALIEKVESWYWLCL